MTDCKCGTGAILTIHEPGCKVLRQIVAMEKRGICSTCGSKKKKQKAWDEDMGMVVTKTRCPKGHSVEMNWMPPTKRDIQEFGLVRKASK